MQDVNLSRLSRLLERELSDDVLRDVVRTTADLSKEPGAYRWLFLLISTCFVTLLDQPGPVDAGRIEPIIHQMKTSALESLAFLEGEQPADVCSAANRLAEAYSHLTEIDAP